jgi:tetratricopeptide (TPR) repeat protein
MRIYDKAIADCSSAIELEPQCLPALVMRGHTYISVGEYQRAITDWTEVIRLNLGDKKAYEARAEAYRGLGDVPHALSDEAKSPGTGVISPRMGAAEGSPG